MRDADAGLLLLTLAGEIHIKSPRTRRTFRRVLERNLRAALERHAPDSELVDDGGRLQVKGPDPHAAADAVTRVFGVHRASLAVPLVGGTLDELADEVADATRSWVDARTFAVRVRRRGHQTWRSTDLAREIGSRLLDGSAGVDLDRPEVEVPVEVFAGSAYLVTRRWEGPAGVPLGTQERSLALLSGGFDSPVAAWMLMRRGSPVDHIHFKLDCAQSDHALVVAHELWRRWGAGTRPIAWVVDFQEVKASLLANVDPRLRQVVLKQLMFAAADRIAAAQGIPALVTGESVGQVSSQTLHHLAEIDRATNRTVLRPLAGHTKEEIIGWARRIGTAGLSARAKEVCDLSDGPVAVAARRSSLDRAHVGLPTGLVARALATRELIAVEHWQPGDAFVPVADSTPDGVALVGAHEQIPEKGPVALVGRDAPLVASSLLRAGREVWVVAPGPAER